MKRILGYTPSHKACLNSHNHLRHFYTKPYGGGGGSNASSASPILFDKNAKLKAIYEQRQKSRTVKLPPFGHRLIDYFEPSNSRIHVSQPKAPVFDLYNSKYVPTIFQPSKMATKSTSKENNTPAPTIKVDSLEKVAVLALRLDHLRHGKCTAEEVRALAKELFISNSEPGRYFYDIDSDIREVFDLESGLNEQFSPNRAVEDMTTDDIITQILTMSIPKSKERYKRSRILRLLEKEGYTKEDLARWMECIRAPTLFDAVQAMEGLTDSARWPKFLLLFTLRRHCRSRLETLELFRLYMQNFPTLDKTSQTKFLFRLILRSQQWVTDLLPEICQIFVEHGHVELFSNDFVCNQVLWTLSGFGRSSSSRPHSKEVNRDNDFALQSQQIIVNKMIASKIPLDTKGYLALAHTLHNDSPERAWSLVNIIKEHNYPVSQSEKNAFEGNISNEVSGFRRREHRSGAFPYIQGLACMEIMLSRSGEEALSAFDSGISHPQWQDLQASSGYNYGLSSAMWAVLLMKLRQLNELTPAVTEVFWEKINRYKVNKSPFLLMQVVAGLMPSVNVGRTVSDEDEQNLINDGVTASRFPHLLESESTEYQEDIHLDQDKIRHAAERRLRLAQDILITQNPGFLSDLLMASYIRVLMRGDQLTVATHNSPGYVVQGPSSATHLNGLSRAREIMGIMATRPSLACYNALLSGESRLAPESAWKTYSALLDTGHEPDTRTLYHLCRAAWDSQLIWTDSVGTLNEKTGKYEEPLVLYAAQRMVVEFKHWVRGAHIDSGDSQDLLKLYPTQQLVYAYIVMLGRAGYGDELLGILPWLERIGMQPDKQILSALITFSPNGDYLMKHGQVVSGGNNGDSVWPTPNELRSFQNMIRKS